jgi:hypothetical protein
MSCEILYFHLGVFQTIVDGLWLQALIKEKRSGNNLDQMTQKQRVEGVQCNVFIMSFLIVAKEVIGHRKMKKKW